MIRCGGAANKTVDNNSNRFVLCEINTRKVQTAYSHSEMHSRSCCGMAARELGQSIGLSLNKLLLLLYCVLLKLKKIKDK